MWSRYSHTDDSTTTSPSKPVANPLLDEAKKWLSSAAEADPGRTSIERWGLVRTPEDDVAEVMAQAMSLAYIQNDRAGAIRLLKEATPRERSGEVSNLLGELDPNIDHKIQYQTQALSRMPHFAKAYFDRGNAHHRKGELALAIDDFTYAIRNNPRLAMAHNNRGIARNELGDLDGAIADYSKALEIDPRLVEALNNRGNLRLQNGDVEGAITDYTRAVEVDPLYALAYTARGDARFRMGDFDGAETDYTRSLDLVPGNPGWRSARGVARLKKSDFDGATADFRKALEVAPPDWPRRPTVEAHLEKALRLSRRNRQEW
jgi:tetratricopeptide (TPR) repeat protein